MRNLIGLSCCRPICRFPALPEHLSELYYSFRHKHCRLLCNTPIPHWEALGNQAYNAVDQLSSSFKMKMSDSPASDAAKSYPTAMFAELKFWILDYLSL